MIIDSKKKKKKKKEPPLEMVKQGLVRSGTVILDTLGPTSDLHTHEYPCYVIALSRLQSMDRLEPHDDLLAKGMLDELTRTSRLKVPSWQRECHSSPLALWRALCAQRVIEPPSLFSGAAASPPEAAPKIASPVLSTCRRTSRTPSGAFTFFVSQNWESLGTPDNSQVIESLHMRICLCVR